MASSSTPSAAPPSTRTKPAQPTNLAKKYGHPYKKISGMSHRVLKNTGKSGITPLTPFFAISPTRNPSRQDLKYKVYYYQQHRFEGFTAAELNTMEALSALDTAPVSSRLSNVIHVMFAKRQWDSETSLARHLPLIPLLAGKDGFWQVDNPIVWKLLEIPLRLASELLENASVWPWWDALFNGNFSEVEPRRIPPAYAHLTPFQFFSRPPIVGATPQAVSKLKQDILTVHDNIKFGFFSGYTNPLTHLPRKWDKYAFGMTGGSAYDYQDFIKVWISVEILQPLLRDDLNGSEQLSNQFRIATTILHECAHAVWDRISSKHPEMEPVEPYFESEPLSEIGWSLEDKLWGGYGLDIIGPAISQGGPGLLNMGIYFSKWFTDAHHNYQDDVPPLDHHIIVPDAQMDADPYYWIDHWPVPTTWTTMIFNCDAWSAFLRPFRSEAAKMGPLTEGTRRMAYVPQSYHNTQLFRNFNNVDRPIDISMTDAERARWLLENGRRYQSRRITSILTNQAVQDTLSGVHPDDRRDGSNDNWDSASDTEDEADEATPNCDRWDEIRRYLFKNRGPNELAWASMNFEIPEWTLYRYIKDRGGLAITPVEWHDFLIFADHRKELFQYSSMPWSGVVKRLSAGWPTTPCLPPLIRSWAPNPSAIATFEMVMKYQSFQRLYYSHFREFRDIDYGDLLKMVNILLKRQNMLTLGDIFDVVDQWARLGQYVTWGPYRIARLTVDIPQSIKDLFPPIPMTNSPTSSSQASQSSQSQGSQNVRNQGSAAGPEAPNREGQANQTQQSPKTQEEIDVENFEKEFDDSGLGLDLGDLDISDIE